MRSRLVEPEVYQTTLKVGCAKVRFDRAGFIDNFHVYGKTLQPFDEVVGVFPHEVQVTTSGQELVKETQTYRLCSIGYPFVGYSIAVGKRCFRKVAPKDLKPVSVTPGSLKSLQREYLSENISSHFMLQRMAFPPTTRRFRHMEYQRDTLEDERRPAVLSGNFFAVEDIFQSKVYILSGSINVECKPPRSRKGSHHAIVAQIMTMDEGKYHEHGHKLRIDDGDELFLYLPEIQ